MMQQVSETSLSTVTAFITRGTAPRRDLLVFVHADGVHVPAGTTRQDETPAQAVLRTAREETGLRELSILAELGSRRMTIPDDELVLLGDALLQLSPDTSSTVVRGVALLRGTQVKVLGSADSFVRVAQEEVTMRSGEPVVTARRSGWLPSRLLTSRIERIFFHLGSMDVTAERWVVQGASEQPARCHWERLRPDLTLYGHQQDWLEPYYKALQG
jgi:hypothetical protein